MKTEKPKTPEYTKRAQAGYLKRLKEAGYKRVSFIIKPEWKAKVKELIANLKEN